MRAARLWGPSVAPVVPFVWARFSAVFKTCRANGFGPSYEDFLRSATAEQACLLGMLTQRRSRRATSSPRSRRSERFCRANAKCGPFHDLAIWRAASPKTSPKPLSSNESAVEDTDLTNLMTSSPRPYARTNSTHYDGSFHPRAWKTDAFGPGWRS
jgi:hypothetical protein